jgi:hypothetical protein
VSAEEPQVRITRFKDLEPQSGYESPADGWSAEEAVAAKPVYVLMGPPKPGRLPAGQPAVVCDDGMSLTIVECPPGSMPILPTFLHTKETFVCLKGRFRGRWGEHGEHETLLDPFDMMEVSPAVCRAFVNVTDESAFLLVMLTGQADEDEPASEPRPPADYRGLLMRVAVAAIGMASVLAFLAYVLWPEPSRQVSSEPAVQSAPVSAVIEGDPGPAATAAVSRPSAPATATKAVPGPEAMVPTEFVRIPPPPRLPPNRASVLPIVVGREATVRVGDLSVTVQRNPRRDAKSRVVDYTVSVRDRAGAPVSAADVRVRGLTVEESTVEVLIGPAGTSGVYQAAVIMPPAGLRQMTLRIVLAETAWESFQQILGLADPASEHLIRLQT